MEPWVEGRPLIIAMKGHPGTGKSTLAHAVATALRYPLIDKDDVRDCTLSLTTSSSAIHLNEFSYQVIWQIAKTQLRLGLGVVIDSPLSCQSRLDHLKQIAAASRALILIVECVSRDETIWRRRVEQRGINDSANWHKPATWQDMKKLIEEYDGCYDYDVGDVPKLVIDTTAQVGVEELVTSVLRFIVNHARIGSRPVDDQMLEKTSPQLMHIVS